MCPGAVEFYKNKTDPTLYPVKMAGCKSVPHLNDIRFKHRWLYGQCEDSFSFCLVLIQVPSGMNVRARMERLVLQEFGRVPQRRWDILSFEKKNNKCLRCDDMDMKQNIPKDRPFIFLSTTNQLYMTYFNRPQLRIQFEAVKLVHDIKYTSNHSGVVTMWHQEGRGTVCDHINAPTGHIIMVSFLENKCKSPLQLHFKDPDSTHVRVDSFYKDRNGLNNVYKASRLDLCVHLDTYHSGPLSCFELLFSFHPERKAPQRLTSGLYNCSVDYYPRFRQHLDCNFEVECEDGRDESWHCPFSSPACDGWVASYQKCYKRFTSKPYIWTGKAADSCRALGYELASVKTEREFEDFRKMFHRREPGMDIIGLKYGSASIPPMYKRFLLWSDKTVIYNAKHITLSFPRHSKKTVFYQYYRQKNNTMHLIRTTFNHKADHFICEKLAQLLGHFPSAVVVYSSDQQSILDFQQLNQDMIICPEGHATHVFLSCDPKSRCWQSVCFFVKGTRHAASIVAMYSCTSGDIEVSYSLLCDFRQDCADNSDESFCYHPVCKGFSCTNGQCLSLNKHCNKFIDCLDGTDENGCSLERRVISVGKESQNKKTSFLINLDGRGYFTQRVMNLSEPCPGTHYPCNKEWFYCLPIYTRCNGVFDCIFQEDERDCEGWTCPGLYRCRDSTVCAHADYMCDGWHQCPQGDDEWLCDMTCPAQCHCQGHAFLCPRPFPAHLFPHLRYLDAAGSGMTLSELMNNTYIVRLSLAHCNVSFLSNIRFPNLHYLDLSYNKMVIFKLNVFHEMPNLHTLILKWNPFTSVTTVPSLVLRNLRKIDLSGNYLDVFGDNLLSYTPEIQYINVSFSADQSIGPQAFQMVPKIKEIDIRGTRITEFPQNVFRGLRNVDIIYAPYYRFCCKDILPKVFPQPECQAPRHYLSSCYAMIQSEVYKVYLWFVAVLASLGNLVCLVFQCVNTVLPVPYQGPVVVFMLSLQCADFCMGIYASVIVAAHEIFRGQYVHYEDQWTDSVACKVAGVFSLMSSEVTALVIFLLMLQHLFLLCCPHRTLIFHKGSAALACGMTWVVGILLASIPLLPGLSHWGQYGQTALCGLMLHGDNSDEVSQEFRFVHAVLVFNFIVYLTVFILQGIIYRAVPQHRVLIENDTNPVYQSVDLVTRIAVIGIVRCTVVTTHSVLTLAGQTGRELDVFMTVMVLPLNSAVNPLLCLEHAVTYRQRQKQEERLLSVLKSKTKHMSPATATQKES